MERHFVTHVVVAVTVVCYLPAGQMFCFRRSSAQSPTVCSRLCMCPTLIFVFHLSKRANTKSVSFRRGMRCYLGGADQVAERCYLCEICSVRGVSMTIYVDRT
jgi:hypothetical protein